jgi:tetratricopeptide (TPR) repeat protein
MNGDFDRAIDDLTKAHQLNPEAKGSREMLARAYSRRGTWHRERAREAPLERANYDRAIDDFAEALRLDPQNQEYRQQLVNAYTARAAWRTVNNDPGDSDGIAKSIDLITGRDSKPWWQRIFG